MSMLETHIKTDVVIIGAGLTGLTTAFWLKKKGRKVIIIEKDDRTGGQIRTFNENGFTFESGPNTGAISFPEVTELMEELNKVSNGRCRLETAPDAAKKRWIWKGDRFHDLPNGPISGLRTPLFTLKDKLRILGEPWRKKGTDPDETVASLAERRLGKSFVDYAVDPFLSGVYAGDPHTLVTRYALPKLYNLEQNYGSFIGGAMKKAKEPRTARDRKATKKVFSAMGGLENITQAETQYIGSENIMLNATKVNVNPKDDHWLTTFSTKDGKGFHILSNQVVTTCGAYALPELLPFVESKRIYNIACLKYAPIIEVAVGMNSNRGGDYKAFGALVPSREKKPVLGILFPGACFSNRAPQNGCMFSFFMGGVNHPEMLRKSDEEIKHIVTDCLHTMLKFPKDAQPDLIKVFRHQRAIPQYERNSGLRFEEVDRLQKEYPGLTIGGNLRDGIGMANRIKQATDMANKIGE